MERLLNEAAILDIERSRRFLQSFFLSSMKDDETIEFCARSCVYKEYPPDTVRQLLIYYVGDDGNH